MINVIIPNEEYSYVDEAGKVALITAGIGGATALVSSLAQKQKRPLSAVEQVCGKKPLIGKGKKQSWQNCASSLLPKINQLQLKQIKKTIKCYTLSVAQYWV